MGSINSGEILVHISITLEPEANTGDIQSNAEKVREEITRKYLGTNNTSEMRREMHKELGERLRNLPGVESVRITTPLTANPTTITVGWEINLETGEITTTDTEFTEGDPVKRPPWATER